MFVRIISRKFVAGIEIGRKAAPAVYFMRKWTYEQILNYCREKKWHVRVIKAS